MGWPIPSQWRARFPENPRKLRQFSDAISGLGWSPDDRPASLAALFSAVDEIAESEVQYYFYRRGTRALISGVCRSLGWIFGTLGVLVPLVTAADPGVSRWGYAFLAVSASMFAANALFGGTAGHVRFVSTQLSLEKLMTGKRIEWAELLSKSAAGVDDGALDAAFKLIREYADAIYAATLAETTAWGEITLSELGNYLDTVKAARK